MSTHPSKPSRPSIIEAETPTTEDEWDELLWETVEEFVRPKSGSASSGASHLHLSPFTFPGGGADEDDDPYPFCGIKHNSVDFMIKDVAVYPPGWQPVCSNCKKAFKHYHNHGRPPGGSDLYPNADQERRVNIPDNPVRK